MSTEDQNTATSGPEVVNRTANTIDESVEPPVEPPAPETAPTLAPAAPAAAGLSLDSLLGDGSDLLGEGELTGSALDAGDLAAAEAVAAEMAGDFAALLASAGGMEELKSGDRVRGTIVSITNSTIFVDVGMKSEAWLDRREALDDDGKLTVEVGQELEAQVVRGHAEGVQLSLGALKAHQLSSMLEDAAASGLPIEGHVTGFNDGGLEVRVGSRRAFCPKSQIDRSFADDLSQYVNQTFEFIVTRFDPTGRKIVLSRRALLEQQASEMAAETRKLLQEGAVVDGTVRKLMPFGVFVDLGGLDGLVHISELAWSRVEDPAEVVQVGESVQVKILRIDEGRGRIGLSMRQAQGDPWETVAEDFEVGNTYEGTVTRLADFGAFVQIAAGIEGLVHVSEIDWSRVKHPKDKLSEGEAVSVAVLEVDKKKRRISLSIKQSGGSDDPRAEAMAGVQKGSRIEVVVEKVESFGIFCTIAEGVTGLLPNSQANTQRGANHSRMFKPGTKLEVLVIDMDRKRGKITLSRKALEEDGARADFVAYRKKVEAEEKGVATKTAFQLAWEAAQDN